MEQKREDIKLELQNITKTFEGVQALDNVSLTVRKGTTHVLCGENGAGKSTLMKIINGLYKRDAGQILIDGKEVLIRTPSDARRMGIAMIHQELSYVPDLTVAENLFLGNWPCGRFGSISWNKIMLQAKRLLAQQGLNYDPNQKLRSMSTSDIQMIEIVKAVSNEAQILIMDEPTSAITDDEVASLFKKIRALNKSGVCVIYISHRLDEVFQIAHDISILRDGKLIETRPADAWTKDSIVEAMVGRKIENQYPSEKVQAGEELLSVRGLSSGGLFKDVSFRVCAGEIVGFAGLMGSGRTEVMRSVFGLDHYDRGEILFEGVPLRGIKQSIENGLIMLSEDRRREGIIPTMSVAHNTAVSSLDRFFKNGVWQRKKEELACDEMCEKMRVKTASMYALITSLSGGNQQKVLLARWMVRDPKLLILDEPTRGIDVGAKNEIYQLMLQLAKAGKGIVMVSSELPELVGMCNRIYVMHEGIIKGIVTRDEGLTQDAIMKLAIL